MPQKQQEITKPLKVAICVTKVGPDATSCYEALLKGIAAIGDIPQICYSISDVERFCPDVLFMVSYPYFDPAEGRMNSEWTEWRYTPKRWNSEINIFRVSIINWCKKHNRRILIIDTPTLKGNRDRRGKADSYYMITYDGQKNMGQYYPPGLANPDRWNKLGLEIKPWIDHKTNNYLIIGQLPNGVATQSINITKFYKNVATKLQESKKNIIFLEHPNNLDEIYQNHKFKLKYIKDRDNLESKYIGIQCAIGFNSNCIIEALLCGVPCIVLSKMSHAYELCSNSLDDLNNPKKFDREWFLHSLSYSQWTVNEMATGEFWAEHYRKYALFEYSGV